MNKLFQVPTYLLVINAAHSVLGLNLIVNRFALGLKNSLNQSYPVSSRYDCFIALPT